MPPAPVDLSAAACRAEWESYLRSYWRNAKIKGLAPSTIRLYGIALGRMVDHLVSLPEGERPSGPGDTRLVRDGIEDLLASSSGTLAAVTIENRRLIMRAFFKFLVDREDIDVSPMAKIEPIRAQAKPRPVIDQETVVALLNTCRTGKTFRDRRDYAIIRTFLSTGARRAEIVGLTLDDLDMTRDRITVLGKGNKARTVTFGNKTADALDRYLRERARHRSARIPALWLSSRGTQGLGYGAMRGVLQLRARQAGITQDLHWHLFRHLYADRHLREGGNEGDLMEIMGWDSTAMVRHYAKATAADRALTYAKRVATDDRY
ncbi:tyrosine-type recombinase/integrase [Parafrankia discariae]|uniref:tyrosine-type recombinase/integrase n=1 Tax=Parafrankia discariae TaxID=365528 RepID=UPI00036CEEC0|nr:tyrosine-type recombinase/integrase [Parafrankia discariae]